MSFVVDKIFEDSFYINLLLGLPKLLDKLKKIGVKGRQLSRFSPCTNSDISAWEQKYSVLLPEDLRSFYTSSDGFLFQWFYSFGRDKNCVSGKIQLNPLNDLNQILGQEIHPEASVNMEGPRYELRVGVNSKLFELAPIERKGKVLLVYINPRFSPTVWFTDMKKFYFLADDFTTYFRMSLSHLGIPYWQFRFSPQGLPQWSENMFRILAPHLLPFNKPVEALQKQRSKKTDDDFSDIPINKIDSSVFKCLPKVNSSINVSNKPPKKKKLEDKPKTKLQKKGIVKKQNK